MERLGIVERLEQIRRMSARIHDAKRLALAAQPRDKIVVRRRTQKRDGRPLQGEVKAGRLVDQGPHALQADRKPLAMFDRRLRRRAEDHGGSIIIHQFLERGERRLRATGAATSAPHPG